MRKQKPAFRAFIRKIDSETKGYSPNSLMSIDELYRLGLIKNGDTYYYFNLEGKWQGEAKHEIFYVRKLGGGGYVYEPWFTTDPNFELEGFTYSWK